MEKKADAQGAGGARSALRGLEIMEAFRAAGRPLSLSELARLARMPVSTCHGVVRALERRGFLYFLSSREFYPTRRLGELAADIDANDPVIARVAPALAALRDETGETAILGVRQLDEVIYLLVIESAQPIRYTAHAGDRRPLHSSAIGKVLLGSLPENALAQWLKDRRLARVTERTITSARRLRADLAGGLRRGYFVTRGENVADVMALAAPMRIAGRVFGVAVAGPLQRMEPGETRLAARLRQCIRSLA
jgi:IclR family transcriptional regulator, acetate operon repressor